jgi:hypothetical protein
MELPVKLVMESGWVWLGLIALVLIGFVWSQEVDVQNGSGVADGNALNIAADSNSVTHDENTPAETDLNRPDRMMKFIQPLNSEIISGIIKMIVSLHGFSSITASWLRIGGLNFSMIAAENTISLDLNTLDFNNAPYNLEANACDGQKCYSETIGVTILNKPDVHQETNGQQADTNQNTGTTDGNSGTNGSDNQGSRNSAVEDGNSFIVPEGTADTEIVVPDPDLEADGSPVRGGKIITKAKKPLRPEPLPDVSGINPNGKRLYTDSGCGDTSYLRSSNNYLLENKCLRAEFGESLDSVIISSNSTGQTLSITPVAIEEINPKGEVIDSVNFSENPFAADYIEKDNVLHETGFEKGRVSWRFNYAGADIHIYYRLVRSYLKWGLEIADWNYSSPANQLRLKHSVAGDFESQSMDFGNGHAATAKKVLIRNNNSLAKISFLNPLNEGKKFSSEVALGSEGEETFIYQTLGKGPFIELDPSVSISSDDLDGTIFVISDGSFSSVDSATLLIGYYLNSKVNKHGRGILDFNIEGIGSIETAELALDYSTTKKSETAGTFDLESILTVGASLDYADAHSVIFETVQDNWFDCTTIGGDINADVTTAWNNAVTAARNYIDFRFYLDDVNRSNKSDECQVEFFDSGEGGVDPYIFYTHIIPDGNLEFSIANPQSDNNTSVQLSEEFLVNGTTTCRDSGCGSVDTNLQYCIGAGCSDWADLNAVSASPLYIVSGTNPQNNSNLTQNSSYNVSWIVRATQTGAFELRFSGDGSTADANTSSGTDRTITIQPDGNLSFVIAKPPADGNVSPKADFLVSGSTGFSCKRFNNMQRRKLRFC